MNDTSIEDLFLEFLAYKKRLRYSDSYNVVNGNPVLVRGEEVPVESDILKPLPKKDNVTKMPTEMNGGNEMKMPTEMNNGNDMKTPNKNVTISEEDIKYMQLLYTNIAKALLPYVKKVLDEYEYDGSFVYDKYIDKESIAHMVDRIVEYAKTMDYVENIVLEDNTIQWDKLDLLRTDIQSLLLNELFINRRPNYKLKEDTMVVPKDVEGTEGMNGTEYMRGRYRRLI